MEKVLIPKTNLRVSKFIYGTGSFDVKSKKKRINFLNQVVDSGFTHFDTSPLYNFGLSEKDLGIILKQNHYLSVTTKVGLYPPGTLNPGFVNIFLRKIVGKIYPQLSRAIVNFNLEKAKKSLEESMRRLNRGHIDILMVHEPYPGLLNTEEWYRWFEDLMNEGKIGSCGIAITSPEKIKKIIENDNKNIFKIIQTSDSLSSHGADIITTDNSLFRITFGYFSDLKKKRIKFNSAEIIKKILERNLKGATIIHTQNKKRLKEFRNLAGF